jgi:hypothetical protein
LEDKARLEATLHPLGARFINRRLRARFHTADRVLEQTSGLEYLFFLRQLTSTIDKDWAFVLDKLERLQRQLINQRTMMINITSDLPSFEAFHPRLDIFIQTLPAFAASPGNLALPCFPDNEGFTIPSQVNYVGKGANLYTLGIEPHGSITVINNYLNNTWLFEKVRLQGGAYGGFCRFDTTSGIFTFLSYRDPNLLTTLENYDQSPHFLERLDLSKNELTKAIIGAIGEIDTYLPPDARGWTSMVRHLTGYPDEVRQHIREEILGTTVGDFRRFAAALDQVKTEGKMVVLGSEEAIKKANTERPGLLEMVKLL